MKLYFYSLRTNKESKPYIKIEECEVYMEGSSTFRPQDKGGLPLGIRHHVHSNDIGKVQISRWGFELPFVVLKEPNIHLAKKILIEEYIDKKIESYKKKIVVLEEKRKAIEQAKEMR